MNSGKSGAAGSAATPASKEQRPASTRRLVEIRCGFAEMACKEADAAEVRAAEARRQYDHQAGVVGPLLVAVDPVAMKAAKEKAHSAFRASVGAARTRTQVETAAAVWLDEVNRINSQNRAAQVRLKNDRDALEQLLAEADRLADTAESAREMADSAVEECRSARRALADSGEPDIEESPAVVGSPAAFGAAEKTSESEPARRSATAPATPAVPGSARSGQSPAPSKASPRRGQSPSAPGPDFAQAPTPAPAAAVHQSSDWLAIDLRAAQPQAIVRLLRRDGKTMTSLAERLAVNEPAGRSRWQLLLSSFVDAVSAAAIDEAWFEFPPGNAFWDLFTSDEARGVARGLTALGFRYDGFGVFANGRVPGQRDLALAIGAAGLLPVRIRFWPNPAQSAELYKNVRVAGDAFLAARAPALTLGELVRVLGRRSEVLADLWNEWPRVRPLLLSGD